MLESAALKHKVLVENSKEKKSNISQFVPSKIP